MPRRRRFSEPVAIDQNEAAASSVAEMCKPTKKRRSPPGPKAREKIAAEVAEMRSSGVWVMAEPKHLVMLYAWCHEQVYKIAPQELASVEWWAAVNGAAKLLREEFGDDRGQAVEYIRWAWADEKRREAWRRENGQPGGRLGWRQIFLRRTLLTNYRLNEMRNR